MYSSDSTRTWHLARWAQKSIKIWIFNSCNYTYDYYSIVCLTLLIRITINAVTVMFAVMNLFPKLINAVIVRPVKMYQTISKHIMFWCHYRFLLQIWLFEIFFGWCWNNKQICSSRQIQLLCYNQELACTPNDPPRRVNMNETNFRNMYGKNDRVIDKTVSKPTLVTPIRFAEIISCSYCNSWNN